MLFVNILLVISMAHATRNPLRIEIDKGYEDKDALSNLQLLIPIKENQRDGNQMQKYHKTDTIRDGPYSSIPDSEFALNDAHIFLKPPNPTQKPEEESPEILLQKCRRILHIDHLRSQWEPMIKHALVHREGEDHKLLLKLCKERFGLVSQPIDDEQSVHVPVLSQAAGNVGIDGTGETAGNMGIDGQGQVGNLAMNGQGGLTGNLGLNGIGHSLGDSITSQIMNGLGNLGIHGQGGYVGNAGINGYGDKVGNMGIGGKGGQVGNYGVGGKGGLVGNLGIGGQGVGKVPVDYVNQHFDLLSGKENFLESLLPGFQNQQTLNQGLEPVQQEQHGGDGVAEVDVQDDSNLVEDDQPALPHLFISNPAKSIHKNIHKVGRNSMRYMQRKAKARSDSKYYVGSYAFGGKGAQIGNLAINGPLGNSNEHRCGHSHCVQMFLVALKASKDQEDALLSALSPLMSRGTEVNIPIQNKLSLAKFRPIGGRRDWVMLGSENNDRLRQYVSNRG